MGFTRYILPALAVAGSALAQCPTASSYTIETQTDADALAGCQKYTGDVIISSTASGTISINGIKQITGDLKCKNATQLSSITSDQLNAIGGTFDLESMTVLANLQFDSLTSVDAINWVALPALQGLNFAQGVQKSSSVYISNTQLYSTAGLEFETLGTLNINNNNFLSTVNVNDLTNVTVSMSFAANGENLAITFPNLRSAGNLTFINTGSVQLPSLSTVEGSMGFYQDTMQSFVAPNLTVTGESLAFVDCPSLNNLSFPSLTEIGGGFVLANNTDLKAINGFPLLKTIVGALDFAGTFGSVTLPALHDVRGGSNVETTSTNSKICDQFNAAHANHVIKGLNNCVTGTSNPQSATGTDSGSSSSTSGNSAANFDPSAPLTGLSALIAAILMI